MRIGGSIALVSGADRGLGPIYALELVARGAGKVYGAARHPETLTEPDVVPVGLDVTDPHRIAQVAAQYTDVSLLRAGSTSTGAPDLDCLRARRR